MKDQEMYENCIELFQFIQTKSYSEAICETVGSIMYIHHGHGRNIHPVNFNKEIYLRLNLPPLHTMKKSLIPSIVMDKIDVEGKEYVSRTTRKEKLKFAQLSASVGNFRLREEDKSHLPISIFGS